jgi:hypothetical protein
VVDKPLPGTNISLGNRCGGEWREARPAETAGKNAPLLFIKGVWLCNWNS